MFSPQASRIRPILKPPLPRAKLVREHENAASSYSSLGANEVAASREGICQSGILLSAILHFNLAEVRSENLVEPIEANI